jgi:hypothetical protein
MEKEETVPILRILRVCSMLMTYWSSMSANVSDPFGESEL